MIPDNLTFQWENDANMSFLSVTLPAGKTVDNFQMNMLAHNEISYLLPVGIYQKNGVTQLSYNITSTMRLTDIQHRVTKRQVASLLWCLSSCYVELPQYGLPTQGLLIDEEYVFLNPETMNPSFVFLPLGEEGNTMDGLSDFIRALIGHSHIVDADEEFSRRMRTLASRENLTLESFRESVSELLPTGVTDSPEFASNPEPVKSSFQVETEPSPDDDIFELNLESEPPESKKKKKKKKKKKSKNLTLFKAVQGGFVILLALMGKSGLFTTEEGFNPSYLFGVLLCIGLADYFLYKKLLASAPKETGTKPKAKQKTIPPYYPAPHTMPNGILSPEEEAEFFSDTDAAPEPDELTKITPQRPAWESLSNVPRLLYQENGAEKVIPLHESLTRVGSYQNMDYQISNETVHMAHAFFYRENDRFFVQDRQSSTGTFLNGSPERVPILEKVEIHPGDTIRLGDVTLKFQI